MPNDKLNDKLIDAALVDAKMPGSNLPEFAVGDLARAIKQSLETNFGRVRVKGEISAPKLHSSGHLYLRLKDADAVLEAVCWKGQLAKLAARPEDGAEVVATGRLTSYGQRSQYQLVIEELALAGVGALLKMLAERKTRLAAEGLFDAARKKPLPRFPTTLGIITSETGAVLQDIIHRLEARYPCQVLLWPVPVQGDGAAEKIAAAITGMNKLASKPDVLIVARGGGSLEDLMPFNEEVVVRAAAASAIPLISAVGHETDTTLIDYAADLRAPTPTAAAELATPVRQDLLVQLQQLQARLAQALSQQSTQASLKLKATMARLGTPARLLETPTQKLDDTTSRLAASCNLLLERRQGYVQQLGLKLISPTAQMQLAAQKLNALVARAPRALMNKFTHAAARLEHLGALLNSQSYQQILTRGFALVQRQNEDGTATTITQAAQVKTNDTLQIIFADAVVKTSVK